MTPIEAGETILRAIDYINKAWVENGEQQSKIEKLLCDLHHELEFTSIDIQRGYKFAKQIQDARRERRKLKDEMELLRILYDQVVNTPTGKKFVVDLTAHLGGAKKRQAQLENRIYSPRSEVFKEQGEVTPCD
jgi:hypothetical protein